MNTIVKKRGLIFEVVFWISVLSNAFTAWSYFFQPTTLKIALLASGAPTWFFHTRIFISVLFLISLFGIAKWKKWGLYGYLFTLITSISLTILGTGLKSPIFLLFAIVFNFVVYKFVIKPELSNFE
ncbi:hypothetical protein KBD71_05635 [Candidatus Woesebacteria bacterium]|nr:hypothetical protein [Candidatus Woesebacteria bacterium]